MKGIASIYRYAPPENGFENLDVLSVAPPEKLVEALRRLCLTVNYCLCFYVFFQQVEGEDDIYFIIFVFCFHSP